ncbi:GIN domain-containing protein [Chloroflexota bacterium]
MMMQIGVHRGDTGMAAAKPIICVGLSMFIIILVVLSGCSLGNRTTVGTGLLETREINQTDFTKLEVGYAFDVEISEGDSYTVKVTVDDNLTDYLEIEKRGDTLRLGLKSSRTYIKTTHQAVITMPVLRQLKLSGASKANIEGFSSVDLIKFDLSGASQVLVSNLKAGNIEFNITGRSHASGNLEMTNGKVNLSGGSTIDLEGSGVKASIVASDGSQINLGDLVLIDTKANLSGASTATVNSRGKLDAELSDASRLYYIGSPALGKIQTSGSSIISHKPDSSVN